MNLNMSVHQDVVKAINVQNRQCAIKIAKLIMIVYILSVAVTNIVHKR